MFYQDALVLQIPSLKKFAFHLTKNKADADDLVQATCLRALEKVDYFKDDTNLLSWTSKIMFNLFASSYRRKMKFETKLDPNIFLGNISISPTQEFCLEFSNTRNAMMQLKRTHREVLILVCLQGMLYKEASEALDIPIGTVRSRLSRARLNLQYIINSPKTNNDVSYI